ncbi:hypothetical protein AAG906_005277 [Vitis piasezkii]
MEIYHLFAKLLDGKTLTIRLTSPTISGDVIKGHLHRITSVPVHLQRLVSQSRQISDETLIAADKGSGIFPTVHLLLPLPGGKGGFGSLLRGAATKAGQKKTNNFDACRDMSGRRLRHVNAEKKLEEWRAEAAERELERMAEDYIKKAAKKGKSGNGSAAAVAAEKYVEKYREESAKCVAEVEASVREAMGGFGKRKGAEVATSASDAKRLKICDSDEDDAENERSIVLDNGSDSDSNKETDGSFDSVSGGKLDGDCSGGSCESGSEEEKETFGQVKPEVQEEKVVQATSVSCLDAVGSEAVEPEKGDSDEPKSGNVEVVGLPQSNSGSENGSDIEKVAIDSEDNGEESVANTDTSDAGKPLNFDDFSSAAEMEVLGLERLKSELQERGLKCGGTLQERAARLFLLKTIPLEKLPKKLLAKK